MAGKTKDAPKLPPLGQVLRTLREERKLSQEAMAHAAGLTSGSYASIELGRSIPRWTTIKAIAGALDVPLATIARDVEALEAKPKRKAGARPRDRD